MPRKSEKPAPTKPETYFLATRRPINCLLFLLPLIVLYEFGSWWVGAISLESPPRRVIAFYWFVEFIGLFTAVPTYLPGLLLALVLLGWQWLSGKSWKTRWDTIGGMAVESFLYVIPLLVLNRVLQRFYEAPPLAGGGEHVLKLSERMIIALTAGIYEELVFRLLLISVFTVLLVDLLGLPRVVTKALVVVVVAALFGLYHYVGREVFEWRTFTFRTAAGVFLGMVFVLRGFGITVGTHAIYDVIVTLLTRA